MTAQASDADIPKTSAAQCSRVNDALSLRELAGTIVGNLKLLVAVPVLAGLLAFGATSALPKWYLSVAYLNLDAGGARAADALMRSPSVLDAVAAALGDPPEARDARAKSLDRNRRIVVAPGDVQTTSKLFRLEYSDRDPRVAQKINSAFISSWLAATLPPADNPSTVYDDLARSEARLNEISGLMDQIRTTAKTLAAKVDDVELAATIIDLLQSNLHNFVAIVAWSRSQNGVSRNVVVSEPSLPEQPVWPNKLAISILTAFAAGLLALVFVLLRHRRAGTPEEHLTG